MLIYTALLIGNILMAAAGFALAGLLLSAAMEFFWQQVVATRGVKRVFDAMTAYNKTKGQDSD